MQKLNDDAFVNIPCPRCGHDFRKPLGELLPGSRFACPGCGMGFDAADFNHGARRVGKTFGEFLKDLKRKFPE